MSAATARLPERDELARRLGIANPTIELRRKFYPILLRDAGRECGAEAIVMMLTLAIGEYAEQLAPNEAGSPFLTRPFDLCRYVDALVDDERVAAEAKDLLREIHEKASKADRTA